MIPAEYINSISKKLELIKADSKSGLKRMELSDDNRQQLLDGIKKTICNKNKSGPKVFNEFERLWVKVPSTYVIDGANVLYHGRREITTDSYKRLDCVIY